MQSRTNIEELRREYDRTITDAERFSRALKLQIEALLQTQSIPLAMPIETRLKDWKSISQKIERKELCLSTIKQLGDFIGLRVILLFKSDVENVRELIQNTFVHWDSEDTAERLGPQQFGYLSHHYIIQLPEEWAGIPLFNGLSDYVAELQIRTISQHIWASASHRLQYKQQVSVPPSVLRSIHRVSALLETVDLELERVLLDREQYLSQLASDRSDHALNVDLLVRFLDISLPKQNKHKGEPYEDLLCDLITLGITTPSQLKQLFVKHLDNTLKDDAKKARLTLGSEVLLDYSPEDQIRIFQGVFYTHVDLVREMIYQEFGRDWRYTRQVE